MEKTGKITQYNKNKGYESISRDFLQDRTLSYEATGLLAELQSYPNDWKLYKTELHKRRSKNKRSSIDRIWKELEATDYLIQFRKRDGKKWDYQYIFSLEKFTEEDKVNIGQELSTDGYSSYFSNKQEEKLEEPCHNNVSSSANFHKPVQETEDSFLNEAFQHSKVNRAETTRKKLTIKEINYKKEEDDYIKGGTVQEAEEKNHQHKLSPFCRKLVQSALFSVSEAINIAKQLTGHSVDFDMVEKQIEAMKATEIFDNVKYFVNGILRRVATEERRKARVLVTIPMNNWAEV